MTIGEILYFSLTMGAVLVFVAILAWQSHKDSA